MLCDVRLSFMNCVTMTYISLRQVQVLFYLCIILIVTVTLAAYARVGSCDTAVVVGNGDEHLANLSNLKSDDTRLKPVYVVPFLYELVEKFI